MRFIISVSLLLSINTISACTADEQKLTRENSTLEGIDNANFDGQTVGFSAITNGCTRSRDFIVEHTIDNHQCQLTIVRNKPDYCRKASTLMSVELSWTAPASCGDLPVAFLNPPAAQSNTGVIRKPPSE